MPLLERSSTHLDHVRIVRRSIPLSQIWVLETITKLHPKVWMFEYDSNKDRSTMVRVLPQHPYLAFPALLLSSLRRSLINLRGC